MRDDDFMPVEGDNAEVYDFFANLTTKGFQQYFAMPDAPSASGLSVVNFLMACSGTFAAQMLVLRALLKTDKEDLDGHVFGDRRTKELYVGGFLRMANQVGKDIGLSHADMSRLRRETTECAQMTSAV